MSKKQAPKNKPAHIEWRDKNGYEKAAKKLKAAKLINWDLRKKLTPAKKAAITRMAKDIDVRGSAEYFYALQNKNFPHAENYLTSPKISDARAVKYFNRLEKESDVANLFPYERIKVTRKEEKLLHEKGIHTHKGYALIRKDKLSKIVKKKVKKPNGEYETAFVQISKSGNEIHLFPFSEGDFFEQLESFKDVVLPIHQRLIITYGLRHPEFPNTYANYDELNKYVFESLTRGNGKNRNQKKDTLANEIEKYPELKQILGIETYNYL